MGIKEAVQSSSLATSQVIYIYIYIEDFERNLFEAIKEELYVTTSNDEEPYCLYIIVAQNTLQSIKHHYRKSRI